MQRKNDKEMRRELVDYSFDNYMTESEFNMLAKKINKSAKRNRKQNKNKGKTNASSN